MKQLKRRMKRLSSGRRFLDQIAERCCIDLRIYSKKMQMNYLLCCLLNKVNPWQNQKVKYFVQQKRRAFALVKPFGLRAARFLGKEEMFGALLFVSHWESLRPLL